MQYSIYKNFVQIKGAIMKNFITALINTVVCCTLASVSQAGEWSFDAFGKAKTLYGYSDYASSYNHHQSHHHLPSRFSGSLIAQYQFNEDYQIGAYVDLSYGIDQQLKDYNHGIWGEEVYGIFDSPYGKIILGQSYNAAYQLGVSAPSIGVFGVNQSDVVNFIANPNWQRNHRATGYRTLNSTDINTDGTAAKITYISPEFNNGTMFGFSYVPDSYSRDGLINRRASYKNKDGYIASLYHSDDIWGITISSSLGVAYFADNDQEVSAGLNFYRKGWTLGGGLRRSWVNHYDAKINQPIRKSINYFDGYRDALVYNIGLSYEFGPFKTALTYFNSKADGKDYEDKIIQFSNSYQFNRYLTIYVAAAHGDFRGENKADSNKGYAYIAGFGVKF